MPYQELILASEGAVTTVTLNRPERRNALSLGLMRDLIDCLDARRPRLQLARGRARGCGIGVLLGT